MIFSIFEGKIVGIAATIIQAVIDKTINIDYVFSEKFFKEYSQAWGRAFDKNDEEIYDIVIPDWIRSLDYIHEMRDTNKAEEKFGVIKTQYFSWDGSQIAKYVIANIQNNFLVNYPNYLTTRTSSLDKMPEILADPEWLKLPATNFVVFSQETDCSLNVEIRTNITLPQKSTDSCLCGRGNTDLAYVIECDDCKTLDYLYNYKIIGFIAALINAIFSDMIRRDIIRLDFFKANDALLSQDKDFLHSIYTTDIPSVLYTPIKPIIDIYYPTALKGLGHRLSLTDIEYVDSKEYVIRKMIDIEQNQLNMVNHSRLWQMLAEDVQQMLIAYHQKFLDFLQKELLTEQEIESTKQMKNGGSFAEKLPTPHKRRYNEVREYIEERKKIDVEFNQYCDGHSRKELCQRLSVEFGWEVSDHSLGTNLNRLLKKNIAR